MKTCTLILANHADQFTDEFVNWLPENTHIWDAFVSEAFKIRQKGFKHYSARTIVHFLRHHSALQENGSGWKINNNHSPYLARLFDLRYPHAAGLWEYRTTFKAYDDNAKKYD